MKYRDLVQFEPISTVIQLRESASVSQARRLVETYVISDRMAAQIADVIIPQLQLDRPQDNKSVLIVGNYGTGKSHLMSVLAAVAEYDDLASALTNTRVRDAAAAIAGRFKVVRVEIGAVTSSLRDIVVRNLEQSLEDWETPYTFPPADQLTNNKDALIAAVGALQARHPDAGLLLVIDELLDYLRHRNEQQLILDLGFLRELGEIASVTPFRFVGGLQETLFDSPRFGFVTDQLRRVRDRFEQVIIGRQDIAYVVANRILRKTDEQLAQVTDHLRPYAPLYGVMAERMGDFARLFPIHPAYLDTFEQLVIVEQRQVLRTVSAAVEKMLDADVPTDSPGLLSFDHYWDVLRGDPTNRSNPAIADVLDKGRVLEERVANAYGRKALLPVATRIVHALSVHRLTTDDITTPVGLTPEELRDGLCLYVRTPEATADFLLDQVRVALREILRTVSGQYISHNDGNDQYYLDVKKDVDFDARIDERGDTLGPDELNRYFFDALRQVLGLSDSTYVTGYRLWEYDVPWADRRVTRPGYLFFGAPDDRNTAQPPRDFYVYLLPPFLDRAWSDEKRADEVIFALTGLDETFHGTLRRYAGARLLEADSAAHRSTYADKAGESRRRLIAWVNANLATRLDVTYLGVRQPATAVLPRAASSAAGSVEELVKLVAATSLAPRFADVYPDYPAFTRLTQPLTESSRAQAATDAVRQIAGPSRTNLGTVVLAGLGLLADDGALRPAASPYAAALLERLHAKPDGQVVNRGEVIEVVAGGIDRPVEKSQIANLEPEWVAVLLVALAYAGEVTVSVTGKETLDASTVDRAQTIAIDALAHFQHFGRPKQVPIQTWATVFERLGLNPALVKDEQTRERAVRELQAKVVAETNRVVAIQRDLANGLRLWNEAVFTDNRQIVSEGAAVVGFVDAIDVPLTSTELQSALRRYKGVLENLVRYNTPGKLTNLKERPEELGSALAARAVVDRAEALVRLVQQLQPATTYLAEAQANLPADHEWSARAAIARRETIDEVRRFGLGEGQALPELALLARLEELRRAYVAAYGALHRAAVLGPTEDDRRRRLYDDPRLKAMTTLAPLDLLTTTDLDGWKKVISDMLTCRAFHENLLDATPTCPSCKFRPTRATTTPAANRLATLDDRLSLLLEGWRKALRAAIGTPAVQASLAAMGPAERAPIDAFLTQADDDPAIPAGFVPAARLALQGLTALPLDVDDLLDHLERGGFPCAVDELKTRFDAYLLDRMRGHDAKSTRLTIERPLSYILAAAD